MAKEKAFTKLGFTSEEVESLVSRLNELLANYGVFYQKVRNFHWNITGPDFFELHEKFEEEYLESATIVDSLAERIRVFGSFPYSTYAQFLQHAEIKEIEERISSDEMVKALIKDYEILLSCMVDAMDEALEIGDIGTQKMMQDLTETLEKKHWMYSAWVQKD
ncbi:Dps family protein [Halocola ammonii]